MFSIQQVTFYHINFSLAPAEGNLTFDILIMKTVTKYFSHCIHSECTLRDPSPAHGRICSCMSVLLVAPAGVRMPMGSAPWAVCAVSGKGLGASTCSSAWQAAAVLLRSFFPLGDHWILFLTYHTLSALRKFKCLCMLAAYEVTHFFMSRIKRECTNKMGRTVRCQSKENERSRTLRLFVDDFTEIQIEGRDFFTITPQNLKR